MLLESKLKQIWGYNQFRPPQAEIIHSLLNQHDTLVIMPTGGGKSICFQLPAIIEKKLTLVISPLVALMENQVLDLQHRSIKATLLHSELPHKTYYQTLKQLTKFSLLYLSPETLFNPWIFQELVKIKHHINRLVVDEAHCLVYWGETFRPSYRRLGLIRQALGQHIAIAAFTATANEMAQQTISQVLQLKQPHIYRSSLYRSNLSLQVQTVSSEGCRQAQLLQFIKQHPSQSGLVYVRTRRDSDRLANWLQHQKIRTTSYHAGLTGQERRKIEQDWLSDKIPLIVCTCAFGMGINKPDVRWILHYHVPFLLWEYIQETGRMGRDGLPSVGLLLKSGIFDRTDYQQRQRFKQDLSQIYQKAKTIRQILPDKGNIDQIKQKIPYGEITLSILESLGQLEWITPMDYILTNNHNNNSITNTINHQMTPLLNYLKHPQCRWNFLLNSFGFPNHKFACGHCDNCLKQNRG